LRVAVGLGREVAFVQPVNEEQQDVADLGFLGPKSLAVSLCSGQWQESRGDDDGTGPRDRGVTMEVRPRKEPLSGGRLDRLPSASDPVDATGDRWRGDGW